MVRPLTSLALSLALILAACGDGPIEPPDHDPGDGTTEPPPLTLARNTLGARLSGAVEDTLHGAPTLTVICGRSGPLYLTAHVAQAGRTFDLALAFPSDTGQATVLDAAVTLTSVRAGETVETLRIFELPWTTSEAGTAAHVAQVGTESVRFTFDLELPERVSGGGSAPRVRIVGGAEGRINAVCPGWTLAAAR